MCRITDDFRMPTRYLGWFVCGSCSPTKMWDDQRSSTMDCLYRNEEEIIPERCSLLCEKDQQKAMLELGEKNHATDSIAPRRCRTTAVYDSVLQNL